MILTGKEYQELVKDFNSIVERLDEPNKREVIQQVVELELKYWKCVKEATFFRYLVRFGDLNSVLWLLDTIAKSKKELKRMQPTDRFYDDLRKEIKERQQELFEYWKDYDPNGNATNFVKEMKKVKWTFLRCGMNLHDNFIDKIFAFF